MAVAENAHELLLMSRNAAKCDADNNGGGLLFPCCAAGKSKDLRAGVIICMINDMN